MAFTSELVVQQTGDFEWKVVKPLSYEGHTDTFTVTSGSTTDFASVPGVFQWLIPREGALHEACRAPRFPVPQR